MAEREEMYPAVQHYGGNKWLYQRGWGAWFGRGPFHARIFYRLLGIWYWDPFRKPSIYDLYLLDCELKDTRDELKRRVKRGRKAALVT